MYHIGYLPKYYPIMYGGYQNHKHYDAYVDEGESAYEIFQFEYSGQWWHMGSVTFKIAALMVPFFLCWRLYSAEAEKNSRGLSNLRNNQLGESYRRGEMPRFEY